MPPFMLSPVAAQMDDPDWSASEHHLECVVIAEDEDHARRLAAARFRAPLVPGDQLDPWLRTDLVRARELDRERDKVPGFPMGAVIPFMGFTAS